MQTSTKQTKTKIRHFSLLTKFLALTFLPPLWAVYLIIGGLGAMLSFMIWNDLIIGYNLLFVLPQNIVSDLASNMLHLQWAHWNYSDWVPIFSDNPHFNGFTFWIGGFSYVLIVIVGALGTSLKDVEVTVPDKSKS